MWDQTFWDPVPQPDGPSRNAISYWKTAIIGFFFFFFFHWLQVYRILFEILEVRKFNSMSVQLPQLTEFHQNQPRLSGDGCRWLGCGDHSRIVVGSWVLAQILDVESHLRYECSSLRVSHTGRGGILWFEKYGRTH